MREQLIQYIDLLFAGAVDCEDIKQEIMQNSLDRYDDLIAQGKVPEAAYRLTIAGIGDINEILGASAPSAPVSQAAAHEDSDNDTTVKKLLRAIAIGLYILCPLPLFILSEVGMSTLGLCGLLVIVAVATVLIILGSKKDPEDESEKPDPVPAGPQQELYKAINRIITTVGLIVYFAISFLTGAWHITWLIFPIMGAVRGLVKAILDLKEVKTHGS